MHDTKVLCEIKTCNTHNIAELMTTAGHRTIIIWSKLTNVRPKSPISGHTCTADNYFKVGIVKPVVDVPSQHEELSPLQEKAVEEAQTKEKLLVLVFGCAPGKRLLVDELVERRFMFALRPCVS